MKKLHKNTSSHRRISKTFSAVLTAAVIVMMLSLTAYAIYRYGLRDLEAGEWAEKAWETSPLSLAGYQDSPEYRAGEEWAAYIQEKYEAGEYSIGDNSDFPTLWLDLGAFNEEMAAKLKMISEQYGLTLPESDQRVADVSSLYAAVGADTFLPVEPQNRDYLQGGTIYNTGSIRSMNSAAALSDGRILLYTFFSAAKGTFSRSDYLLAEPENFEEWEYVTDDGTPVLLAISANKSLLVANLDNCFIFVNILSGTENNDSSKTSYGQEPIDRGDLETFADGFDFVTLNALAG